MPDPRQSDHASTCGAASSTPRETGQGENVTLPVASDTSPARNVASPLGLDTSPTRNVASPLGLDTSPTRNVASPLGLDTSPTRNVASPLGLDTSPTRNVASPLGLDTSPTRNVALPLGLDTSPTRNVASPLGLDTSPTRNVASPLGLDTSPTGNVASPLGLDTSPTGNVASPLGLDTSPTGNVASPLGLDTSPTGNVTRSRANARFSDKNEGFKGRFLVFRATSPPRAGGPEGGAHRPRLRIGYGWGALRGEASALPPGARRTAASAGAEPEVIEPQATPEGRSGGCTLMIRPRRSRREPGRDRRGLLRQTPLVAIKDRAVLAVTCLHPVAERDEILVRVHDGPLKRLRRSWVVPAVIEGDPSPPELFTSANLWPRQSTAHSVFLEPPRGAPSGMPPGCHFASCADPLPREIE